MTEAHLVPGQHSDLEVASLPGGERVALSYIRFLRGALFSGQGFGLEIQQVARLLKEFKLQVLDLAFQDSSILGAEFLAAVGDCYLMLGRPTLGGVRSYIKHSSDSKNFSQKYTRPVEMVDAQLFLLSCVEPGCVNSPVFQACGDWSTDRKLKYLLANTESASKLKFLRHVNLPCETAAITRRYEFLVATDRLKSSRAHSAKLNILLSHAPSPNAEYLAHVLATEFEKSPSRVLCEDFQRISQKLTSCLPSDPQGAAYDFIDRISAISLLSPDNHCEYRPHARSQFTPVFINAFADAVLAYRARLGPLPLEVIEKIDAFFASSPAPVAHWAYDAVRGLVVVSPYLSYARDFQAQERQRQVSQAVAGLLENISAVSLAMLLLRDHKPNVEAPFFYEMLVAASTGPDDIREAVRRLTNFIESSQCDSNLKKLFYVKDVVSHFIREGSPLARDEATIDRACLSIRMVLGRREGKYKQPGYFELDPLLVALIGRHGEPFSQTRLDLFDMNASVELIMRSALLGDAWVPDRFINEAPGGSPRDCIDLFFDERVQSKEERVRRLQAFYSVSPTSNNLIFYGVFLQAARRYLSGIEEVSLQTLQTQREADFARVKQSSVDLSAFGELLAHDPVMKTAGAREVDLASCAARYNDLMASVFGSGLRDAGKF